MIEIIKEGNLTPTSDLVFCNPEGKKAIIDFGGDKLTYSGDMPVDESAKMFFEAFFGIYKDNQPTNLE